MKVRNPIPRCVHSESPASKGTTDSESPSTFPSLCIISSSLRTFEVASTFAIIQSWRQKSTSPRPTGTATNSPLGYLSTTNSLLRTDKRSPRSILRMSHITQILQTTFSNLSTISELTKQLLPSTPRVLVMSTARYKPPKRPWYIHRGSSFLRQSAARRWPNWPI